MLEIAGGIVLGFLALGLVFLLIWLGAAIIERLAGSFVWIAALLGALGLWYVGCFVAGEIMEWLGPGKVHDALAIIGPLALLAGVWLLFFDSLVNFKGTKAAW